MTNPKLGDMSYHVSDARGMAKQYVSFVVDDAGNGRELGADHDAIIRENTYSRSVVRNDSDVKVSRESGYKYRSVLVGWQCGFEPLFVAVHSYLDVRLDDDEAIELATDYLVERGWFASEPTEPDYIIR